MTTAHVYVIRSKNVSDKTDNFYIGSTNNFDNRCISHKSRCNNVNDPKHNLKIYEHIRSNGGWDCFIMYSLFEMPYTTKDELYAAEQRYINFHLPGLNERRALGEDPKTKHVCECGGDFTTSGRSHHLKTKVHINFIATGVKKSKGHDCDCGGNYFEKNKNRHIHTERHLKYSADLLAVATHALM